MEPTITNVSARSPSARKLPMTHSRRGGWRAHRPTSDVITCPRGRRSPRPGSCGTSAVSLTALANGKRHAI